MAYDLASNQDFADFVKSQYYNSISFFRMLNEKGIYNNTTIENFAAANTMEDFQSLANYYDISFDTIKETYSDPLARFVYFQRRSDLYASLSKDDMLEVISYAFNVVIQDEEYKVNNPNSPLLVVMDLISSDVNTQRTAQRGITGSEIAGCVASAAGAFVAENWTAIKNLYSVLSGEGLTFGVVKSAAQLLFPEIKGVWTICTFVSCLLVAALN